MSIPFLLLTLLEIVIMLRDPRNVGLKLWSGLEADNQTVASLTLKCIARACASGVRRVITRFRFRERDNRRRLLR